LSDFQRVRSTASLSLEITSNALLIQYRQQL
jgi:hypothetical protein